MSAVALWVNAGNDRNGNPRRGWIVVDQSGEWVFVDEGYAGRGALRGLDVTELRGLQLAITPGQYRDLLKVRSNPRPRRTKRRLGLVKRAPPTYSRRNLSVDVWEERDRLHIELYAHRTGKPEERVTTIAEWWDDDARQMFEDGFFESRRLEQSVIDYAQSVGFLKVVA